jgi:hypothetical protein
MHPLPGVGSNNRPGGHVQAGPANPAAIPASSGGLPTTGTDIALLLALAGAAIAVGAGALVVTGRVPGRKLDRAAR